MIVSGEIQEQDWSPVRQPLTSFKDGTKERKLSAMKDKRRSKKSRVIDLGKCSLLAGYGGHTICCSGLGALSNRHQDFPMEAPSVKSKRPCPLKDDINNGLCNGLREFKHLRACTLL